MSKHPSKMTEAEKSAMFADEPGLNGGMDPVAAEAEPAEPAKAAKTAKAAKADEATDAVDDAVPPADPIADPIIDPAAAKAPPAETDPPADKQQIPKERFDEVNIRAKQNAQRAEVAEARAAALEAQLAASKAAAVSSRDFAAEAEALDARYDNEQIDFADYKAAVVKLAKEQERAEVLVGEAERMAALVQQIDAQRWEAAQAAFLAENPIYTENRLRRGALNEAIQEVGAEAQGKMSYAEVLAEAKVRVDKELGAATVVDPLAARNAANAKAASAASAVPAAMTGGTGNRKEAGTDAIDWKNMKPGAFGKLTKEQQAAALGGERAL